VVTVVPADFTSVSGNRDWEKSVENNCHHLKSTHIITTVGYHTLKVWMVDPAVALEKIVVNTGGVKPSYLGPPESFYR
jgi:Gylcosyl hydrolase family 115 C-terminal domain